MFRFRNLSLHLAGQRFDPTYPHQNDKPQGQKPCGFLIPRGSDAPYPNRISTLLAPIFQPRKMGAFFAFYGGDLNSNALFSGKSPVR